VARAAAWREEGAEPGTPLGPAAGRGAAPATPDQRLEAALGKIRARAPGATPKNAGRGAREGLGEGRGDASERLVQLLSASKERRSAAGN